MSSVIAGVQHPFLFTIVFRANAQSVGISLRNVCRKPLLIKKNSIKGTYNTPVRFIDSIFFYKTSEGAFPMETIMNGEELCFRLQNKHWKTEQKLRELKGARVSNGVCSVNGRVDFDATRSTWKSTPAATPPRNKCVERPLGRIFTHENSNRSRGVSNEDWVEEKCQL